MQKSDQEFNDTLLSGYLGKMLKIIYEAGIPKYEQGKFKSSEFISVTELMKVFPKGDQSSDPAIKAALTILKYLGLINIEDREKIRANSRYGHFALGSLAKFFETRVAVATLPLNEHEERFLIDFTEALEKVRKEKAFEVDQTPLHERRIVNVIVKGKQLRGGKKTDVYLHVYHPEWKEYHLIGLSHKDDSKTDEEIAQLALEKQVGLKPDQYILDPNVNPKEKEISLISQTNGALTLYTFCVRTVKEIKVPLKLKDWMNEEASPFGRNWFRWFTFEEIKQRKSYQGEIIMESTPLVLEGIDLASLPVSAIKSQDARVRVGLRDEIGQRFSTGQLVSLIAIVIASLVFILWLPQLPPLLEKPLPLLDNILKILTFVFGTLGPFVYAIYKGSRK